MSSVHPRSPSVFSESIVWHHFATTKPRVAPQLLLQRTPLPTPPLSAVFIVFRQPPPMTPSSLLHHRSLEPNLSPHPDQTSCRRPAAITAPPRHALSTTPPPSRPVNLLVAAHVQQRPELGPTLSSPFVVPAEPKPISPQQSPSSGTAALSEAISPPPSRITAANSSSLRLHLSRPPSLAAIITFKPTCLLHLSPCALAAICPPSLHRGFTAATRPSEPVITPSTLSCRCLIARSATPGLGRGYKKMKS